MRILSIVMHSIRLLMCKDNYSEVSTYRLVVVLTAAFVCTWLGGMIYGTYKIVDIVIERGAMMNGSKDDRTLSHAEQDAIISYIAKTKGELQSLEALYGNMRRIEREASRSEKIYPQFNRAWQNLMIKLPKERDNIAMRGRVVKKYQQQLVDDNLKLSGDEVIRKQQYIEKNVELQALKTDEMLIMHMLDQPVTPNNMHDGAYLREAVWILHATYWRETQGSALMQVKIAAAHLGIKGLDWEVVEIVHEEMQLIDQLLEKRRLQRWNQDQFKGELHNIMHTYNRRLRAFDASNMGFQTEFYQHRLRRYNSLLK